MDNYFEILEKCRMFTGLDIEDIKCLTEILNMWHSFKWNIREELYFKAALTELKMLQDQAVCLDFKIPVVFHSFMLY